VTTLLLELCNMETMKKYAIVEFVNDQSVETIPACWLTNDGSASYWPPCKTVHSFKKYVADLTTPDRNKWELCSVRVLKFAGKQVTKVCF
jgi:hypothetical protein